MEWGFPFFGTGLTGHFVNVDYELVATGHFVDRDDELVRCSGYRGGAD